MNHMKSHNFEVKSFVPIKTTQYLIEFCAYFLNFELFHLDSSKITTTEIIKEFERIIKSLLEGHKKKYIVLVYIENNKNLH